jgi:predicted O-methyltransferase YrrM
MESKKHSDLFLPNQEFARYLYHDPAPYQDALYAVVAGYADQFGLEGHRLSAPAKITPEEMSSPAFLLAFFNTIIKLTGAKTVLEIGTFIGHSTMHFARMVGKDGHVTTLEVFKEFADIARRNFADNGYTDRITLIEGDAGASLMQLPKRSFDLVFIDGAKQSYLDYALQAEELIADKGVIAVDDVFFHGDAINAVPSTNKGMGCKRLLDHYRGSQRFEKLLLPLRNGILLLFRKPG